MKKLIILLLTALMFLSISVNAEVSEEITLTYDNGMVNIENIANDESEYVLIAAEYNKGEIVQIKTHDVESECSNIPLYKDFDYDSTIRCMLWDSLENMKPTADVVDITLDVRIATMDYMDSSGSGPMAMVVDEVETDGVVYTLSGYFNGVETQVTTNKNTMVGELTSQVWTSENDGKNFDATTVWNTTGEFNDVDLKTIIEKGDIILYTSDGDVIAKFTDAEEFEEYILNGAEYKLPIGAKPNKSTARVGYYFNALESVEVGDWATIKIKDYDNNIVFNKEKAIDVVTISKSNGVSVDGDIEMAVYLIPYNEETKTGDYVYVSTADKGQINNIIVYRFTE